MGYSVREQVWWVMAIVTFILLGLNGEISEGCLKQEREALLKLKEAFNYPNGDSLPSWNNLTTSYDCCTWEGVHCDNSTHRVTSLLLGNKRSHKLRNIKWSLNASSFLPFPYLQKLNLSGNHLSGLLGDIKLANLEDLILRLNMLTEFPSIDVSHSRHLKRLWLDQNLLEGSIPESIWTLTSLTELVLEYNKLNGSLPQQGGVCNLKNLLFLSLTSNKFEGELPRCMSNLTSLHTLYLVNNGFSGTFPSSIFLNMSSLIAIGISDDHFSGSFSLSSLATHSNLIVLAITCYNTDFKIETENPPFIPSFQLQLLRIIGCALNEGNNNKLPSFLLHQRDLLILQLTRLNISGTFPSWLFTNNSNLHSFHLAHNLFHGPFEFNSSSKWLQLEDFDISANPIRDKIPSFIGFIFPNLISLNMSFTSLTGCLPNSVAEMRQLNELDLSNNYLSGNLPHELGQGMNELRFLKLSNNNFSGPCLTVRSNLTHLLFLGLNNNNFLGQFPSGIINSTKLEMLDLSNNQLFGAMPMWIGNFQNMSFLVLSNNHFSSSLPRSFCNLTQLTYLDLSQNEFNGSLPNCLNMPLLKYLHMQNNNFMGTLPETLANSPLLLTLDLMKNEFSSQIPRMIRSLLSLRVLILKENRFEGSIPAYLCELKNISLLDLSQNKLSGGIPYCLNNITFGQSDASRETIIGSFIVSWTTRTLHYDFDRVTGKGGVLKMKADEALTKDQEVDFTTKWRDESYEGSVLNLMSGLDLSRNQLTGDIPSQIGSLSTLRALNLSNNHLKGFIPETFCSLKQIESLDVSHNNLTGRIPAQLIQLNFLSVFSVAYNNLSGMTPDRINQFLTFEASSYEGNPFLYGPPLHQNSSSITMRNKPPHHLKVDDFQSAFLWTFAGAFGVFFLGVILVLYFNPYIFSYKILLLERALTSYLYG